MTKTLEYYNQNAELFSKNTFAIDMSALYQQFLSHLPPKGNILDIGCGSGRDALFFHQQGYEVTAFDFSPELVQLARKNTGLEIQQSSFYDLQAQEKYVGIWACASLLHCERTRLPEVIAKIIQALKPAGVCYLSFKYGSKDRDENGRIFTDLNEAQADQLFRQFPNIYLLQQWVTADLRPDREESWLNILFKKYPDNNKIPSANTQIQFIADIQQLLATAQTTSTYKFALLISLVRIAIERSNSSSDPLSIPLMAIAEKFIELYWQQARPYFPENSAENNEKMSEQNESIQMSILRQNTGHQAKIITQILEAQKKSPALSDFKRNRSEWDKLLKTVRDIIHKYPLKHLQMSDTTPHEFLYHYDPQNKEDIVLHTHVGFCLTRFSIFIEEICQKYWMDNIRLFKGNQDKFGNFPNLDDFLFSTDRSHLTKIKPFLHTIQKGCCFYCGEPISIKAGEVDHFIPWSLYQYDTAHNFVLADRTCNNSKRNNLASLPFYKKWLDRNAQFDQEITQEIGQCGFLVDRERSESIAQNYYSQVSELHNENGFWQP